MTDTPEGVRLADRLGGLSPGSCTCDGFTLHHPDRCPTKIIQDCCAYLRREADKPATAIYGNLLWHHLQAARKDFNGPERKRISDLIDAFETQYPAECKIWDDRYPRKTD